MSTIPEPCDKVSPTEYRILGLIIQQEKTLEFSIFGRERERWKSIVALLVFFFIIFIVMGRGEENSPIETRFTYRAVIFVAGRSLRWLRRLPVSLSSILGGYWVRFSRGALFPTRIKN